MSSNDYIGNNGLAPVFHEAGRAWNVDPDLLMAIGRGESGGQGNSAVSPKGALGLMQLMPPTAAGLGVTDPTDNVQAIFGAAKLMRQNLDAAKGDVPTALKLYQGGPNTANWGPQNAAYPGYIMSKYVQTQRSAPANALVSANPPLNAKPVASGPSDDELLATLSSGARGPVATAQGRQAATSPGDAPAPANVSADDALLAQLSAIPPASPQTAPVPQGGIARNAAAGLSEGGAGVLNAMSDPVGNLIGKPLVTAGMFAHDALAPVFGYNRFTDAQRNDLLKDDVLQPGNRLLDAVSGPTGPTSVPSNTLLERMVRAGTAGAVGGAALGGNALAALMGASGGATGQAAETVAPGYAGPMANIAGNILGAGAVVPAAGLARAGGNLLMDFGNGVERPGLPMRIEPTLGPAKPVAGEAAMPETAQPAPSAMGAAATPSNLTAMGAKELAANQARNESNLLANPLPRGYDATEYVKGVRPTAAEVTGDANVAVQQKGLEQTPGQKEVFAAQRSSNNDARLEHYDNLSGDPVITNYIKEARDEQAKLDLTAAWKNKTNVDASPVVAQIDEMLNGPVGKQTAVANALNKARDALHDSDGKLETDPEMLYGARKEISNLLGKQAQQETPTLQLAAKQLMEIKATLDGTIEDGAAGYKKYLENFANASKPIDTMEILQDARPNLTNGADRTMTFAKYDRFMKGIVAQRQASGANPYQSIPAETMDQLFALHSDLARVNRSETNGRASGSDTSMLRQMTTGLGNMALHGTANAAAGLLGVPMGIPSMLINSAKTALAPGAANRLAVKYLDGPNFAPPPSTGE